ncbi:MAG: monovalent cation/H(+) antiporter subunit G [Arenicellales bacterium]|nr:monovalent cation/H(+) antiporter subunit G [Arenicellales bacterium]
MNVVIDIVSAVCLIGGSAFVVIGGIGLIRMPDFFTRLHAAGVCETLGAWLVLLGLLLQAGWSMVSVKLIMIFLMLAITGPTATHALAKSALHGGVKPKHLDDN